MSIAGAATGSGTRSSFPPADDTFHPRNVSIRQRAPFADAMRIVLPFLVLILGLLAIKPGLLRVVFPAATCVFGYRLYRRNETYFLSFLLWIYMLAPLLRRLVDWKTFYQEQSYILLAALLVTLIPAIDLRRRLISVPPAVRSIALFALAGIAYGFGVGCLKHPGSAVCLAAATWSAPIILCVFAASIREREDLDRVLTRTFLWGVLLIGIYGIYQFAFAPPWDTYWLINVSKGAASLAPSFGQPRPFGIRVWSTMNAPGPLATYLTAALLWLATRQNFSFILIAIAGYATFLLTLVRSSWFETALGLALLIAGCRPRLPLRGLVTLLITFIVLGFALYHWPQAQDIQQRIRTFSTLSNDESAIQRRDMYRYFIGVIASSPTGAGLDTVTELHGYPIDSSLILMLFMLGWIGALCYLCGFARLTYTLARQFRSSYHPKVAAAAIVFALLTQITSGDVLFRQGGLFLWLFVGIWFSLTPRYGLSRSS